MSRLVPEAAHISNANVPPPELAAVQLHYNTLVGRPCRRPLALMASTPQLSTASPARAHALTVRHAPPIL